MLDGEPDLGLLRDLDARNSAGSADVRLFESLAMGAQPRTHLLALYQGWIEWVEAFRASRITGRFAPSDHDRGSGGSPRRPSSRYEHLQREIGSLRAQAAKEKQLNRRVELNLTIRRLEAELGRGDR